MAISSFRGFPELLPMEDPSFSFQYPVNSFDNQAMYGDNMDQIHHGHVNHVSHVSVFDYYKPVMDPSPRPTKQIKTSSWNSSITSDQSLMNLNGPNLSQQQGILVTAKEEMTVSSKINHGFSSHLQFGDQKNSNFSQGCYGGGVDCTKSNAKQSPAQDHILAERKRREKLSQRFIALSALLPGLKKMDKASVLGDAIKHMKTLQEKVKTLEEQIKKRPSTESVFFVKRYEVSADVSETSSSDGGPIHEQLPEIEARFVGNNILIRIHCEKKKGVVEKILTEIEKLHLSVNNSTAMTFASYALDVTVTAQIDKEFTMTMKDLVKNLRLALKQFL